MMKPNYASIILGLFILSSPASAQTLGGLLNGDSLDWALWEAVVEPEKEVLIQTLGLCAERYGEDWTRYYHFVEVSGDGHVDLIYSGPDFGCDEVASEGSKTIIYQNRNGNLVRVFTNDGVVVSLSRTLPWDPVGMVLRYDGCCGDPFYELDFFKSRFAGELIAFELSDAIQVRRDTPLPEEYYSVPRRFRVTQESYNLRITPSIDDDYRPLFAGPDRRGNVLAEYTVGATGIAFGEKTDETGRVWWFVTMNRTSKPTAIADELGASLTRRVNRAGWISSRYLEVVGASPATIQPR
jgi:hypothetical protein